MAGFNNPFNNPFNPWSQDNDPNSAQNNPMQQQQQSQFVSPGYGLNEQHVDMNNPNQFGHVPVNADGINLLQQSIQNQQQQQSTNQDIQNSLSLLGGKAGANAAKAQGLLKLGGII